MVTLKEVKRPSPSKIARKMPARSLTRSVDQSWRLTEQEALDEQALLKRVQDICREYGLSLANEVEINGYRALPPEAVSVIEPPERAWLVGLSLDGDEQQVIREVEMIVVLQTGEVYILLR